jgi:antitoxin (DNA-binding transcriptional repressor) of toxin-antitoxin stability system
LKPPPCYDLLGVSRMTQRIAVRDAATQFSELLHRVRNEHVTFVFVADGEEVGQLSPVSPARPASLKSFFELLESAERPDEDFAGDLEEIQAEQPTIGEGPWHS